MVTPLEWRRHFYDRTDGAALAAAVLAGVLAAATLAGAVFNVDWSATHPSVILAWVGLFSLCCGGALAYVARSGVIPPRRGHVNAADGITHVRAGSDWLPLAAAAIAVGGTLMVGIGVITADAVGAIHISHHRQYPAIVVGTATLIIYSFWNLARKPIGRRLEFSPHGFASQVNSSAILVPWDSVLEVNVHRGPSALRPFGIGKRAEIVFTTTEEARFPSSPGGPHSAGHPIGLLYFDVDEDTLLNVILAAVSHPEIRQLLGREEGTILFDGPPLDTRRAMSRSQVWLPWEQQIKAALGRSTGAEPAGEPSLPATD